MSDLAGCTVLVMAKAPVPGRSKTRLCPPCTPEQAAHLAAEALSDTLEAVQTCGAGRRVLALDGEPGPWLPDGFEVVVQRGDGFDQRLAAAWDDTFAGQAPLAPTLQIGMDTPQVTPDLLDRSLRALTAPGVDSVLGRADDGGWWAIGLHRADPGVFLGVPMSRADTGAEQERRLCDRGLHPVALELLRDVDRWDDALAVADLAPSSRFTVAVDELSRAMA